MYRTGGVHGDPFTKKAGLLSIRFVLWHQEKNVRITALVRFQRVPLPVRKAPDDVARHVFVLGARRAALPREKQVQEEEARAPRIPEAVRRSDAPLADPDRQRLSAHGRPSL
jgi:hypothetical protein